MLAIKVYERFKTDTDKLNIVVYRNRSNLHLNWNQVELELTEQQTLLAQRVYLLCYNVIFLKRCIVLDQTIVQNWMKPQQELLLSFQ